MYKLYFGSKILELLFSHFCWINFCLTLLEPVLNIQKQNSECGDDNFKKKMVVVSLDYFLQPSKVTPSLEKQLWKSQLWKSISPVPGRISRQTQLQENPRSLKNQRKKRFHVPNVNALDLEFKNWNWTRIGSTAPESGPSGILRVKTPGNFLWVYSHC